MSQLNSIELAPADPILGLNEAFAKDERATKVNLGVGVYLDETGTLPLLDCVRKAEQRLATESKPHGYLPIDGLPVYREAVRSLVSETTPLPWRRDGSPPCRPWAAPEPCASAPTCCTWPTRRPPC